MLLIAVLFLGILWYLLRISLGSTGGALGPPALSSQKPQAPQNVGVGGGPPPAVRAQLDELRARIAAHPGDDVALVQLGDLYLAVGKYDQAIPYYRRALRANPKNVAAQTGLEQAHSGIAAEKTP